MCGICGVFGNGLDRSGASHVVQSMMDRLAHRGPDGDGIHVTTRAVIGHRRLAVIDVEHGGQPMHSEDRRHSVILNGEIYNYVELRQQLEKEGARFRTASDTEVLLQMLMRHGVEALSQLNGMFAFAFVDHVRGRWLLARDPLGIKPLYYAVLGEELAFASEIKALLLHPWMQPEPNWTGIQHYLTFQFCLGEETLFQSVKTLEPGCYMEGSGGTVERFVRYWDTNYAVDEHHTQEYFAGRLLALLQDSARLQIRSDVPVGAYLSGGLDSTVVAALAAERLGGKLPVFHGRFAEGPQYDESAYARAVSRRIGAELREITPTAREFVESLPRLIYHMDEPAGGPGLFPQYMVSREAVRHVKVVLGGQGGDEIFGGYARYLVGYLEQALKGAIFETQDEGKHIVTLASIIPNLPLLREYRPLMQQFWRDGLFESMDARYFRLIDRSPTIAHLLTEDVKSRIHGDAVFADFQRIFNHPDTRSYVNKMTHFDLKTLLPALLQVEDRVSMAVSLESRVPLIDARIINLVTTMPPPMKFQGGNTKFIFKDAVRNLAPEAVLARKDKMGFPVPLSEWMSGGPVRDFVRDTLLGTTCRQRGIFRPEAIEALITTEPAFGRQLWGALCLELWFQQFIDGPRPTA